MTWLVPAILSIVGFAIWAALGKRSLDRLDWVPVSLIYAAAATILFGILLPFRRVHWDAQGMWVGTVAGVAGAAGLAMFYLALSKGKASVVVPMIGVYPVVTALISVLAFGERLGAVQIAGVVLATVGVVLIGAGS